MTTPEIASWSAAQLEQWARAGGVVLEATCFGVPVCLWDGGLSTAPGPWSVDVYPDDHEAIESEPVDTAEEVLTLARTLCRQWAPGAYDAWQTRDAINHGLQAGFPGIGETTSDPVDVRKGGRR